MCLLPYKFFFYFHHNFIFKTFILYYYISNFVTLSLKQSKDLTYSSSEFFFYIQKQHEIFTFSVIFTTL